MMPSRLIEEIEGKKWFSFTRKKSLAHHDEIPNFQEAPMPSITITEIFRKF
jgi:hypothetical protein